MEEWRIVRKIRRDQLEKRPRAVLAARDTKTYRLSKFNNLFTGLRKLIVREDSDLYKKKKIKHI